MTLLRLKARLTPRQGEEEAGVALVSALLFIVIMAGLSLVLLSVVLGQITPTYFAQKQTKTISTAQAGVQAALGQLRSAASADPQTGKLYGDLSKLPCAVAANVDGQAGGASYEVTVDYFRQDPTGQTAQWQSANKLSCSPTSGLAVQPTHALITSQGKAPAVPGRAASLGDRAVSAVYSFSISNINIAGGRIFNSNKQFCLQASGISAGATVAFVKAASCTDKTSQLWLYAGSYQIKLASTVTNGAAGLCITGPLAAGGATADAQLQPCLSDAARWNQLWSWTGDYSWRGQQPDIALGTSSYCLAPGAGNGSDLTGKTLLAATSCNGTFVPEPEVGAGNAGPLTTQLVNYREFGRCADVTAEDIAATFMISYPCKQDPTGTGTFLKWNHKWFYSEPAAGQTSRPDQQIWVNYLDNPASRYCFESPSGAGQYPTFAPCNSANARQNWTRYSDTGQYATSYVIVDYQGRCLTVNPTDLYNEFSKVIVTACTGSTSQKWNAPPIATEPVVSSFKEITP